MKYSGLYIGTDGYRALVKQGTERDSSQWFVSVWQLGGMAERPALVSSKEVGIDYLNQHYQFAGFKTNK